MIDYTLITTFLISVPSPSIQNTYFFHHSAVHSNDKTSCKVLLFTGFYSHLQQLKTTFNKSLVVPLNYSFTRFINRDRKLPYIKKHYTNQQLHGCPREQDLKKIRLGITNIKHRGEQALSSSSKFSKHWLIFIWKSSSYKVI